jgi:uncharacterized integral membrane protein
VVGVVVAARQAVQLMRATVGLVVVLLILVLILNNPE